MGRIGRYGRVISVPVEDGAVSNSLSLGSDSGWEGKGERRERVPFVG